MIHKIVDYIKEDEFRITIFTDRVHILNYEDLLSLEETRISVKYDKGRFIIKGECLTVQKLMDQEILISGKIKGIEMES